MLLSKAIQTIDVFVLDDDFHYLTEKDITNLKFIHSVQAFLSKEQLDDVILDICFEISLY